MWIETAKRREGLARSARCWHLLGRPHLRRPRTHRLPWAVEPRRRSLGPALVPGAMRLPLPPWPGLGRSGWLRDELLPALADSYLWRK